MQPAQVVSRRTEQTRLRHTYVSLKSSYVPSRVPEYTNSRIIDAVKPCVRLSTPSLRTIAVPIFQNALALLPGTGWEG